MNHLQRSGLIASATLLVLLSQPALAATIVVNETTCTLVDAITAANTDTPVGGCTAGSGMDVVELQADVTLTAVDNSPSPSDYSDSNGLPVVISDIIIDGGGFTIERDTDALPFRFFRVESGATLTLEHLTLRNGLLIPLPDIAFGGAVANHGTVHMSNVTLINNSATRGGAVSNHGVLTISDTGLLGNDAGAGGGGIANFEIATVTSSTIADNVGGSTGSGILNLGSVTVTNSTVSRNSGAGVFSNGLFDPDTSAIVTNSTVTGNSEGGVFGLGGLVTISNSIIADNSGVGNCSVSELAVGEGQNFSDDPTCGAGFANITPGVDFDTTLANNGGPTKTHALVQGSVAIDAAGNCGLATDQRGLPRSPESCDSGAFELGPIAAIPPPVPDGQFASPMRASRSDPAGTAIDVAWNVGLCPSPDYHLIYGNLADVFTYSVSGSACSLGVTGTASDVPVPSGDLWFLVLANDDVQTEGSWGQTSGGERNEQNASAQCGFVLRDNSGTCP